MGKSTTAKMFAEEGVPVWDADAAVHALYAPGGAAVEAIGKMYPEMIVNDQVDRAALRAKINADPSVLDEVQGIVHPLVAADRAAFLREHDGQVVLLDIPLLFETGANQYCDVVVVVSVPEDVQRARVLARGQMTEAEFEMIRDRQMPDAEKRARADVVIETLTLEAARAAVRNLLRDIKGRADARNRAGHGDDGL